MWPERYIPIGHECPFSSAVPIASPRTRHSDLRLMPRFERPVLDSRILALELERNPRNELEKGDARRPAQNACGLGLEGRGALLRRIDGSPPSTVRFGLPLSASHELLPAGLGPNMYRIARLFPGSRRFRGVRHSHEIRAQRPVPTLVASQVAKSTWIDQPAGTE
jgi:hypothetical protein